MTVDARSRCRWPAPKATRSWSPAASRRASVVVTAGVHVLTPGQKVRLYAEPDAPRRARGRVGRRRERPAVGAERTRAAR